MTDSAAGETMNVAPGGRSMGRPPLAGGDAGRSRTNDRRDAEVAGSSPVRPVSSAATEPIIRRMYRVTITTPDGTLVFVGDVTDNDRIAFVQEAGKSSRVELTATEAIEGLTR